MKLLSLQVIKNRLTTGTSEEIQVTLLSMLGHAHIHGNIKVIVNNFDTIKKMPDALKMIAFINKYAPVKYTAKTGEYTYIKDDADREIDLLALPQWNEKAPKSDVAKPVAKLTSDSIDKKITDLQDKLAVTTDILALRSQLALKERELAAIRTQISNEAAKILATESEAADAVAGFDVAAATG